MKFEIENGIGIIKLEERFDISSTTNFKEKFTSWTENCKKMVTDMSNTEYIDSTGLGTLVWALKTLTEKDGDLKIAVLNQKPRIVFEITRAHKIFEIYDSVEAAIKSY